MVSMLRRAGRLLPRAHHSERSEPAWGGDPDGSAGGEGRRVPPLDEEAE
jgi:hypothetical protein